PFRGWPAYGLAAVGVVVATLIRLALDPLLNDVAPFVTYFATSILLFLMTGTGPAAFEALVGGVAGFYLFVEPRSSLGLAKSGTAGFVFYGLTIGATLLVLRSLRAARTVAERRQAELLAAKADVNAQRETLRATLASIGDAVVATDRAGHVTF